jgi:hypothetical protein
MTNRQRLSISHNAYTAQEIGEDEMRRARANRRNICRCAEGAMKPNKIVSREEWLIYSQGACEMRPLGKIGESRFALSVYLARKDVKLSWTMSAGRVALSDDGQGLTRRSAAHPVARSGLLNASGLSSFHQTFRLAAFLGRFPHDSLRCK